MRAQHTAAIDVAVRGYQERPMAGVEAMFDHLFAHPPAGLAEQRDAAVRAGPAKAH